MLDVVRGLAAEPLAALEMVGWVAACTGATILASACVGAALGVPHALAAALVIVPAIELAKLLPITPGNVGLTSAAVAIALHAHGVPLEAAVAAGITLHAVETVVGLCFGAAGTLSLTPAFQRRPRPLVWLRPRLAWALPAPRPRGPRRVAAGRSARSGAQLAAGRRVRAALPLAIARLLQSRHRHVTGSPVSSALEGGGAAPPFMGGERPGRRIRPDRTRPRRPPQEQPANCDARRSSRPGAATP